MEKTKNNKIFKQNMEKCFDNRSFLYIRDLVQITKEHQH